MAGRPEFKPILTKQGWMLSVPPMMSGTGKRKRIFFPDEKLAKKSAANLRARYHAGERSGVISRNSAVEAAEAARILEPYGISLLDAAKDVAKRMDAKGSRETFAERFARLTPENEMRLRNSTWTAMEKMMDWFPAWFAEMRCAMVTPDLTRSALTEGRTLALSTLATRMRYVSAILNHKERHRKTREISIMDWDRVADMVMACSIPGERRAVGLMIFAGIRPSADEGEITRLDWETVGKTEIYVPAGVSKTHSDRIIPITPMLAALIEGHEKSGPVIPAGWRRRYARLRKTAGIEGENDITRHTFASHFLAAFGEDATKSAMGHTEDSRTLFRHYRRAVSEAGGLAFFEG